MPQLLTTKQERTKALEFFQRVNDQARPGVAFVFTLRLAADYAQLEAALATARDVLTRVVNYQIMLPLPLLASIKLEAGECLRSFPVEKETNL